MTQEVVATTATGQQALTQFDPCKTNMRVAGLKAAIDHARRIEVWPLLDDTVEMLVDEIIAFVAWWDETVTPGRNGHLVQNTVVAISQQRTSADEATDFTGIPKWRVSHWRHFVEDRAQAIRHIRDTGFKAAWPADRSTRDLLSQSDQNDWRTPRKFLHAAHEVMGGIDLDPASSAEANQTVKAERFYTKADNGLKQPWSGRVWLNPPYGGDARLFVERLVKEFQVGNVTAACTLLNSHPTETKWFQELFDYTICFIKGRIDFGGPSREVSSSSTHGSAIAYLGDNVGGFAHSFGKFGAVVRRVK